MYSQRVCSICNCHPVPEAVPQRGIPTYHWLMFTSAKLNSNNPAEMELGYLVFGSQLRQSSKHLGPRSASTTSTRTMWLLWYGREGTQHSTSHFQRSWNCGKFSLSITRDVLD